MRFSVPMRSSLIEKERPHCLAMTANTCFSRLCRLPCHITSVGSESHATNPVALLRCTTMQVLGFVDTRDFAVHPTSENLGVVCRWEVRPLLPHRKKARAMLPDCSMEREWKVSAGAVIHRWAGNGLSWSNPDLWRWRLLRVGSAWAWAALSRIRGARGLTETAV